IKQVNGVTYLDWGREIIVGDAMLHEARTRYGEEECLALSESLAKPIQVVTAGKGFYVTQKVSWHSRGHAASERVTVEGADHCFHNGAVLEEAIDHTLRWFGKFS